MHVDLVSLAKYRHTCTCKMLSKSSIIGHFVFQSVFAIKSAGAPWRNYLNVPYSAKCLLLIDFFHIETGLSWVDNIHVPLK